MAYSCLNFILTVTVYHKDQCLLQMGPLPLENASK